MAGCWSNMEYMSVGRYRKVVGFDDFSVLYFE